VAANEKKLAVPFHKQQTTYYCGPACIQMILEFFGVRDLTQDALWADVQNNTGGVRPPDAPEDEGAFDRQVCYFCGAWRCWYTTPEALTATVNQYRRRATTRSYLDTSDQGTEAIRTSIDSDCPAAAVIYGFNHWVIVNGYRFDTKRGAGYPIQGFYVLDPQEPLGKGGMSRLVTIDDWLGVFASMDCGPHTNKYPLVGRS
jgi:hypothetical protein